MQESVFRSPRVIADPFPVYRQLRESAPVYWDEPEQWWLFTRHNDVTAALLDGRLSAQVGTPSVDELPVSEQQRYARLREVLGKLLMFTDPPAHTRLRRVLQGAFTTRNVADMADSIGRVAGQLRDSCVTSRRIDLLRDFAEPLSGQAFAMITGAEVTELRLLQELSHDIIGALGGAHDSGRTARAQQAVVKLQDLLAADAARAPRDGLLSALSIAMTTDQMTEDEAIAALVQILTGGLDPTPQAVAASVVLLLRHHEQRKQLIADPGLVRGAVEEVLRYEPPFLLVHQVAIAECDYGGQTIRQGDHVALMLGAANRDPAVFEDAEEFRIDRSPNRHVSFGLGAHLCLGAGVVRLTMQIALHALLPVLGEIRLEPDDVRYRPLMGMRSLESVAAVIG